MAHPFWSLKPWWCQPWTILLTGTVAITTSWLVLHIWWLTAAVAVLVLAGVQLVLAGLIGEYLGRTFLTLNRKPQYLVREVFRRGGTGLDVERPKVDTRAGGQPHREHSGSES